LIEPYTVNYKDNNIYCYKMNTKEKTIIECFRKELIDICNALDVPRGKCFDGSLYMGRLQDNYEFVIKYKEDIGYFALNGERGMFSLMKGFPTKNKEEAKFILLKSEFSSGGFMYELNLRTKLEKEWTEKYSVEYDFRKVAFEYAIKMLNIVFKCFPDNVITEYTMYMDGWYFDKNEMSFKKFQLSL